jgi:hypothetical protein
MALFGPGIKPMCGNLDPWTPPAVLARKILEGFCLHHEQATKPADRRTRQVATLIS